MAKIYQELKLDVLKANNAIRIQAKQNDVDSRYLKVTVTEDGKPIDMSGFTSVQINVKRDDGENEAFAGEIAEGVVIVPIPSWALEVAGYASCDISMLNGEGEILTTLSFRLYVEKSNYKREITEDSPNYTAFEQALIDIEALKGGGSSGGGGFRKIGFTEDCDFVATEGDGLTAFRAALEAATDGDTILVMSGVYEGSERFDVTKNVDFIGIGRPEIDFPIWISGGGVIEDWVIVDVYPSVTSRWTGFDLWGGFEVGCEYDPDGNGGEGCGIIEDCEVSGHLNLTGAATNCYINVDIISSGHYYGSASTEFKQCFLKATQYIGINGGSLRACEIYPSSDKTYEYYTNSINATFSGCRIYALGTLFSASEPHGSSVNLGDSIVFANSISGCQGGYLVTPTAN